MADLLQCPEDPGRLATVTGADGGTQLALTDDPCLCEPDQDGCCTSNPSDGTGAECGVIRVVDGQRMANWRLCVEEYEYHSVDVETRTNYRRIDGSPYPESLHAEDRVSHVLVAPASGAFDNTCAANVRAPIRWSRSQRLDRTIAVNPDGLYGPLGNDNLPPCDRRDTEPVETRREVFERARSDTDCWNFVVRCQDPSGGRRTDATPEALFVVPEVQYVNETNPDMAGRYTPLTEAESQPVIEEVTCRAGDWDQGGPIVTGTRTTTRTRTGEWERTADGSIYLRVEDRLEETGIICECGGFPAGGGNRPYDQSVADFSRVRTRTVVARLRHYWRENCDGSINPSDCVYPPTPCDTDILFVRGVPCDPNDPETQDPANAPYFYLDNVRPVACRTRPGRTGKCYNVHAGGPVVPESQLPPGALVSDEVISVESPGPFYCCDCSPDCESVRIRPPSDGCPWSFPPLYSDVACCAPDDVLVIDESSSVYTEYGPDGVRTYERSLTASPGLEVGLRGGPNGITDLADVTRFYAADGTTVTFEGAGVERFQMTDAMGCPWGEGGGNFRPGFPTVGTLADMTAVYASPFVNQRSPTFCPTQPPNPGYEGWVIPEGEWHLSYDARSLFFRVVYELRDGGGNLLARVVTRVTARWRVNPDNPCRNGCADGETGGALTLSARLPAPSRFSDLRRFA